MTAAREHRRRWALTAAAGAVSLLTAASTLRDAVIARQSPRVYVGVALARGGVFASYARDDTSAMARSPRWRVESSGVWGAPRLVLVPRWVSGAMPIAGPSWNLTLPLWPAALALGGAAAWMWHRHLTCPAHLCRACRYDLSGSAGAACPECGAATGR